MKSKPLYRIMILTLLALSLALAGCAQKPATPPKETPKKVTFTYAVGTDARTLDPQFVGDVPTSVAVMQIHETLVGRDDNYQLAPALATSWSVAADGVTWTFKLRQGVKFHDGTDFNAEAVKYTFERILDPATASPRKSYLEMIKEIKVVDPYTVQLITSKPFGPFLAQLSSYNAAIMSPTKAKAEGKGYAQKPAGTGPFMLKSWTPGDTLVFEKNPNYWGEKSKIDELTFKVVPEDATRVMLLKSGGADVVGGVPAFELAGLKADPNVAMIVKPGFRTIYVGMNVAQKPFDNQKVREAIQYGVNVKSIVDNVLKGNATLAVGMESPDIPGAAKTLPTFGYDPAKAKQLLKEAGFPNGFKTVFHTCVGRYPMDQQVSEAVVGQLKLIGIDAELKVMEFGAYQDMLKKGTESRLFLLGKGSPTGDPDMTLTLSFGTKQSNNQTFYSDKAVDDLLAKQRSTTDAAARALLLQEVQEKIYKTGQWLNLYYEQIMVGTNKNVKNLVVLPNEQIIFSRATK